MHRDNESSTDRQVSKRNILQRFFQRFSPSRRETYQRPPDIPKEFLTTGCMLLYDQVVVRYGMSTPHIREDGMREELFDTSIPISKPKVNETHQYRDERARLTYNDLPRQQGLLPLYILHPTPLDNGGMGEIFEGWDIKNHRRVAIKKVFTTISENLQEKIETEAKILQSLDHPNIVKFIDYIHNQDGRFLVMEQVGGQSLRDTLISLDRKFELIPPETVYSITEKLGSAIVYMAERGVFHRDLKPGNILLHLDNSPTILDFGVAQLAEGPESFGHTLLYSAPEYYEGKCDLRTEMFVLALIVYNMLSGKHYMRVRQKIDPSLPEAERKEIREQIVMDNVINGIGDLTDEKIRKDLISRTSGMKEKENQYLHFFRKALNRNPDLRYQDMESFLSDLRIATTYNYRW